jgi:hypothetical protein
MPCAGQHLPAACGSIRNLHTGFGACRTSRASTHMKRVQRHLALLPEIASNVRSKIAKRRSWCAISDLLSRLSFVAKAARIAYPR